jgi:cytoskeletal protein CcmA (bactofilin family)
MSTLPGPYGQTRGGTAVLGKSVIVKGQIFSREDLIIDGEVEGTVELQEHRLTVGPNGKVRAAVKAREICVIGTVHGDVEASDKVDIRKDGKLVGDIRTARITIEEGAYFKGNIDIIRGPRRASLPVIDSPEAEELDAVAERDIREGRFGNDSSLEEHIRALAASRAPADAKPAAAPVPALTPSRLTTGR